MKAIVAVMVGLMLTGCAVGMGRSGADFDARPAKEFVKGKTTQEEVLRRIGQPLMRTLDQNGKETWTYMYTVARSTMVIVPGYGQGDTDINQKSLFLTFNGQVLETMALRIPSGLAEGLQPPRHYPDADIRDTSVTGGR